MDAPSSESSDGAAPRHIKVTVLGDGSVGKSSICNRFCKDFYAAEYRQTLGLDFFTRQVSLPEAGDVVFNLFDIGGQALDSRLLPSYCRGSDCVLYVYDLTNGVSLENLVGWKRAAGVGPGCTAVLVGNKSDLATKRMVRAEDVQRVDRELRTAQQFTVSALTGDRIAMMFVAIAGLLTGADVHRLMLDERKVVAAQVRPEDLHSAAAANASRTIAPASQPRFYQSVTPAAPQPRVDRIDRADGARKRRGCGAM